MARWSMKFSNSPCVNDFLAKQADNLGRHKSFRMMRHMCPSKGRTTHFSFGRVSFTVSALLLSLSFGSLPSNATILNAPGTKCVKVGAVAKSGTIKVKCTKSGKITSWKKINDTEFARFTAHGPTGFWTSVASSIDGRKLAAIDSKTDPAGSPIGGHVYTSSDFGVTWTAHDQFVAWNVVSSSDGTKLFASYGTKFYSSSNAGSTWNTSLAPTPFREIAVLKGGSKIFGVTSTEGAYLDKPGHIYVSKDFGSSWVIQGSPGYWTSVASSKDGSKLIIGGSSILTSSDSGASYKVRTPLNVDNSDHFYSVATSDDGKRLVAANSGRIYTTVDSGSTWTAHNPAAGLNVVVASSSDGKTVIAAGGLGQGNQINGIFFSADSGATWVALEPSKVWWAVSLSGDGTRIIATSGYYPTGQIYISRR